MYVLAKISLGKYIVPKISNPIFVNKRTLIFSGAPMLSVVLHACQGVQVLVQLGRQLPKRSPCLTRFSRRPCGPGRCQAGLCVTDNADNCVCSYRGVRTVPWILGFGSHAVNAEFFRLTLVLQTLMNVYIQGFSYIKIPVIFFSPALRNLPRSVCQDITSD